MFSAILSLIDFGSIWFWLSLLLSLLISLIGILWIRVVSSNPSSNGKIVFCLIIFAPMILDTFLFINMLRKEPIFDYGFNVSVVFPVGLFYSSIFLLVLALVLFFKSKHENMVSIYIWMLIPVLGIKVSFGLAHSSPAGILLSIFQLCLICLQIITRRKDNKQKLD